MSSPLYLPSQQVLLAPFFLVLAQRTPFLPGSGRFPEGVKDWQSKLLPT